jgi:hypothetical protein
VLRHVSEYRRYAIRIEPRSRERRTQASSDDGTITGTIGLIGDNAETAKASA